jgi:2-C-methyl-D-erythritol 2,4-cyclodiphosphate synthase
MRIGHGYDVHKLAEGRKLILGGVDIPHFQGLLGHSDADVLTHAVMDALLGAAAIGDIGQHFPSNDKYKNANSIDLLKQVGEMLKVKGYQVVNIDSTIIAEKPRLSEYILQMRKNLANALDIDTDCVSVKATTEEGLGVSGSENGMAAHAVVLINR